MATELMIDTNVGEPERRDIDVGDHPYLNEGEDMYGNHPDTALGYVRNGRPLGTEVFIGKGELSNEQHEAFAQAVAAGNSLSQAARMAGYTDGPGNSGSRMMKIPAILARVTELRGQGDGESAMDSFVRKPFVVAQLVQIHYEGLKKKDLASACRALEALVRIGGLDKTTTVTMKQTTTAGGKTNLTAAIRSHLSKLPRKDRLALLAAAPELHGEPSTDPEPAAQAEVDGAE